MSDAAVHERVSADPPALDLRALLAPIPREAFFEQYWETQPLLVTRQDPAYFGELLSLADLDWVIYCTRPKFPSPCEADGCHPNAAKTFLRGQDPLKWTPEAPQELDLSDLAEAYRGGRTVIVNGMERRWPAVARLCCNLQADLHHPVGANLYLTPPGSQGFPAHCDTHDVFIVQVEGAKHWRVYGSPERLPLAGTGRICPRDTLGRPEMDFTLQAGDVLYVPRGFLHEACTTACHSLHLTLGIYGYRWADLLAEAVHAAAEHEPRLRKLLPPGYLDGDKLQAEFRQLLQLLGASASLPAALGRIAQRLFKAAPILPAGKFLPQEDVVLTPDTPLEKLPGLICRVVAEGDTVTLQCQKKEVRGPRHIESALRHVAGTSHFTARSLPTSLNEPSRMVLVRRLLADGLLRVVQGAPGSAECASARADPRPDFSGPGPGSTGQRESLVKLHGGDGDFLISWEEPRCPG
jgi:hypothetical protein